MATDLTVKVYALTLHTATTQKHLFARCLKKAKYQTTTAQVASLPAQTQTSATVGLRLCVKTQHLETSQTWTDLFAKKHSALTSISVTLTMSARLLILADYQTGTEQPALLTAEQLGATTLTITVKTLQKAVYLIMMDLHV